MRKEQQYANLYGPYAPGRHTIGDTIRYGPGPASQGRVIWSYRNEEGRIIYVVDDDSGFPVELEPNEIVERSGE